MDKQIDDLNSEKGGEKLVLDRFPFRAGTAGRFPSLDRERVQPPPEQKEYSFA